MAELAAQADRLSSSHQHRAAVHVEDLAGNEASQWSTKKKDGRGDLLGSAHASERYFGENFICHGPIVERRSRHIGVHPTWSNTVHIDMMRRQLSGETFDHADDRAFGRRVIGMKRFAPLPGGGADQYYVRRRG